MDSIVVIAVTAVVDVASVVAAASVAAVAAVLLLLLLLLMLLMLMLLLLQYDPTNYECNSNLVVLLLPQCRYSSGCTCRPQRMFYRAKDLDDAMLQ
jgi:hypothetical protein